MAVDLHLHTTASDGTTAPREVVALAAAAGLSAVAITDHDTLAGIDEARAAASNHGIELIAGIELSLDWPTGNLHLLVYFLEPGTGPLQERLASLRTGRHNRNTEMVAALQDMGVPITYDEVLAEAGGDAVGRPHLGAVLVAKGVVADMKEAFERYLGNHAPAYRPRRRLGLDEAVELATASGAVTSVAHPHSVADSSDAYEAAFRRFAAAGVAGVECWYAAYAPDLRAHLADLTRSFGLIPTGGSDFHGAYKPDLHVGTGRGDLVVPDETVDALESRRPR